MAQEENERLDLFSRLEQLIGSAAARTLMERLPPMPWHELATKGDLRALEGTLRAEMQAGKNELRADVQAAKQEMLATFRGELNAAITTQTRTIVNQTRTMILTMVATVLAVVGFVLTLAPSGTPVS